MDSAQIFINIALTIGGFFAAFIFNQFNSRIDKCSTDLKEEVGKLKIENASIKFENKEESHALAELALNLANNYVKKDDFKDRLDRIESKIDKLSERNHNKDNSD